VIHAEEVIEMGEHPTRALSQKPNSSIGIGFALLKEGKADVFASAGNTGAMMVGSLFSVKTIDGIQRPAIAGFVPQVNGKYAVMLDIGANADCKPEMLEQWGLLGSVYFEATTGQSNPRVGLMNIGEEEGKGSMLAQATHALLKENKQLNFIGNIEGKDLFRNRADVIVTDGFTGNIVLKMGESIYNIMKEQGMMNDFVENTNYENYGGSPIIGINGNVIIAHGASSPKAIRNMVKLCKSVVESNVCQKIKVAIEEK
jgi:glycerol-3-phosphate acyltransferase PlsX